MGSMLKNVKVLLGDETKLLTMPIILSILDSFVYMSVFGFMILTLQDLSENTFTMEKLQYYTLTMIVLLVVRCVLQGVGSTMSQARGVQISSRLRLRIGDHIRSLNLGFFNKNSIGKLNSILTTDIKDVESVLTHTIGDFFKTIGFTLMGLIVALAINVNYALIVVLIVMIAFPLLSISGKVSAKNSIKLRGATQGVVSRIVEYINGIRTFRLYNLTGVKFERLDHSLLKLKKESTHMELSLLPYTISFSAVTSFMIPAALLLGTYFLINQSVNPMSFLAIVLLSISLSNMMSTLGALYPQMKFLNKATENILAVMDEKPFSYEKEEGDFKNYDVAFEDVSFRYTEKTDVLKNISFQAKSGTTTALIGPSGSGKTTIASLISRFWDVNEGKITIDGKDIRTYAPDVLTKHMAVVFQEVYLLNDTVYNNLKIAKPDATREEVMEAAKAANCHDFIMDKEQGYDTMIGEGGSTLSGGEKQRISIARALLKDASIVLLDETTSSLDADNEKEIQKAFDRLMKNKTVLVIAHRLNTIVGADNILVLNKGEVMESGNHKKLLAEGGWYARMYEEQQKAQNWKVKG